MGKKLLELLNPQFDRLRELSYSQAMGGESKFSEAREKVTRLVESLNDESYIQNSIPVLAVVSEFAVPLVWQIAKIDIDGKKGRTCIDVTAFKNRDGAVAPRSTIYSLLGVQMGNPKPNLTISEHLQANQKFKRRGLTAAESAALLTQESLLGSEVARLIRETEVFPLESYIGDHFLFWSRDCARPTLGCIMLSDSAKSDRWSFPSCDAKPVISSAT